MSVVVKYCTLLFRYQGFFFGSLSRTCNVFVIMLGISALSIAQFVKYSADFRPVDKKRIGNYES